MREKIWRMLLVITLGVVLPSLVLRFIPSKPEDCNEAKANVLHVNSQQTIGLLQDGGEVILMDIEDYVVCVVLAEMPADFELEALKAQAVIARTYGLKRASQMDKHNAAAVCTQSSCCQGFCAVNAYKGSLLSLERIKSAVEATKGQVLTYEGQLIEATYFSCSGGRTEDALAVWGTDVPYLQATESPGEEGSDHYISTVTFDTQECIERLELSSNGLEVGAVQYTDGGGVANIEINGNVFTGVQIRQLLSLKSTAFRMNVVGNRVIITVKGYGHRVGMSQYGADAMAAAGSSYQQILAHYYSGTLLSEEFI